MFSIVAVVVSFNPEIEKIVNLVTELKSQVERVVIVDNGSSLELVESIRSFPCFEDVSWISLGENKGVAAAHNVGIDAAKSHDADYVILFDHDSLPGKDMVQQLVAVAKERENAGYKVASVGPNYFDGRQNNPPPFIEIKALSLHRNRCDNENNAVTADYLISSGCLIPMKTLEVVGNMREDLFIDFIDIEWGLRAKSKGYQSFGACAAQMKHDLGDSPAVFLGKAYPARSPLRHYYHFRNAIWMYRQPWVPINWKLVDGWKLFLKFGFYSLVTKPQVEHFKMMLLGIWHGLSDRMGRLH